MNTIFVDKKICSIAPKKELVCALPFTGKNLLQLRSKLVKSIQNNLSFCYLKVVFQSPYKIRGLFQFKDTLDKKIGSNLVYYYCCSNCNAPYYRRTYQHFFTRSAEHMGISNLTGKLVKNVKESEVSDHLVQRDSTIDFDHFDILASDTNSFRLLIKEILLINRYKPVLNRQLSHLTNLHRTHSLYYIIRIVYLTIELYD